MVGGYVRMLGAVTRDFFLTMVESRSHIVNNSQRRKLYNYCQDTHPWVVMFEGPNIEFDNLSLQEPEEESVI